MLIRWDAKQYNQSNIYSSSGQRGVVLNQSHFTLWMKAFGLFMDCIYAQAYLKLKYDLLRALSYIQAKALPGNIIFCSVIICSYVLWFYKTAAINTELIHFHCSTSMGQNKPTKKTRQIFVIWMLSDHMAPRSWSIEGLKPCSQISYSRSVAGALRFPLKIRFEVDGSSAGGLYNAQITCSLNISSGDTRLLLKRQESKRRSWRKQDTCPSTIGINFIIKGDLEWLNGVFILVLWF